MQNFLMGMPDLQPEEMAGFKELTKNMTEAQQQEFYIIYQGKRKKPQDILLLTCIGFLGFAGIQRLVINQIGMGILYFLTGGLCLVGTIIDIINHKQLATDYNLTQMYETSKMIQ